MSTTEEMINKMYDSSLASQKEQLGTDYAAADAALTAQKEKNQKAADANIHRTNVAAQKAAVSDAEYYAASGLTSGAKAQARIARENQLQSDLTAIRTAQQEADAQVERERSLLAKDYTAAIRKAQAQNDLQKAQALYEQAQKDDAALLAKQEAAANLMAGVGDFSAYGSLYGLTDAQIAQLSGAYKQNAEAAQREAQAAEYQKKWDLAKYMYEYLDDDTYLKALMKELGITPPEGLDETEPEGTPPLGNAYHSPQLNMDGTFTVGNRTMTASELSLAIQNGTARADYDPTTNSYTFTPIAGKRILPLQFKYPIAR